MSKLEELKHLLAHQNFEGRMDVLIETLADLALKKLKPAQASKAASVPEPSASSSTPTSPTAPAPSSVAPAPRLNRIGMKRDRSRYIPAQVRRQVLLRDQNGCTYKDPKTGRVCGARHGLQFDHLVPFSRGGEHSVYNLALRCGAHNRIRAEQMRHI